jgi:hypothetical protein
MTTSRLQERLTLITGLHGTNDATPGVHNTLAKRDDIVQHLIRAIVASGDGSSLLQNLGHNRKVLLKVATNGAGNIAEALENSRLELVGKGGALEAAYVSCLNPNKQHPEKS